MYVKKSNYTNFRNIVTAGIEFISGINILYGDNAMGKTTAIEGIYLCSAGRSHRTAHETEIVRHGEDFATVNLIFQDRERSRDIGMSILKDGRKGCRIGGVPIKRMSDFTGVFKAVMFSPENLSIVKDGPAVRRRFIDSAISKNSKEYLKALQKYHSILEQRNKLLTLIMVSGGSSKNEDTLVIWDSQLAETAEIISNYRAEYIGKLNIKLREIFSDMTSSRELPELLYKGGATKDELMNKLLSNRAREMKYGITMSGPHKDELDIILNGGYARLYASQGQCRSLAVALKLAEGEICKEISGEYPVYLLDDILSEFDKTRRDYIMKGFWSGNGSANDRQVIITSCEPVDIKDENINKISVENGKFYRH